MILTKTYCSKEVIVQIVDQPVLVYLTILKKMSCISFATPLDGKDFVGEEIELVALAKPNKDRQQHTIQQAEFFYNNVHLAFSDSYPYIVPFTALHMDHMSLRRSHMMKKA